jgi:enterochelin esterase-like enzyme
MVENPSFRAAPVCLVFTLALAWMLVSCQPGEVSALDPTSRPPQATQTMSAAQTLTQSTPAQAPQACTDTNGTVTDDTAFSQVLNETVSLKVYLPPCYQESDKRTYPVLYMLHGQSNVNDQWERLGLFNTADELISKNLITPFIIVLPSELRSTQDPFLSKFEAVILEDVLPYVEAAYRVCPGQVCRAVGGLSRGGNWAVHIGLSNPGEFVAIGAHSTPLFYGEISNLYKLAGLDTNGASYPALFIDVGNKDEDLNDVKTFVSTLKKLAIPYQFSEFLGYHDENYWRAHVNDYLRWYSAQFAEAR